MSYNGELSNKPTKIDIPAVDTADGYTAFNLTLGSGTSGGRPFWITNDRIYVQDFNGFSYYANLEDPANGFFPGYTFNNGNVGIVPTFGYTTAIDGYFYSFNNTIDGGLSSSTGGVFRSLASNFPAFSNIATLSTPVHNAMVYVDATYIWVFGGLTALSTSTNVIQRCARANPTVWSNVGTMPISRSNAALAVVGTNIYMYGGINESGNATNTIYTATVANPSTWTNTGSTLPTTTYNGSIYNDGTNVYLLGAVGPTVSTDILRAAVGTPASMSKVGSMVIGSSAYAYAKDGVIYSIGNVSFNNVGGTYVERATVANPLSWSGQTNGLAVTAYSAHSIVSGGSIYVVGGRDSGGTAINNVQMASTTQPLNFASVGTLPAACANGQIVKTSNKAYLIGGNGTTGNIYEAPLSNLSTGWTLSTVSGPTRSCGKVFTYRNYLFYVGGETNTSTSSSSVGRAVIEGGSITTAVWQGSSRYQSSGFPSLSRFGLVTAGDFVYAFGGHSNGTADNGIYRARLTGLIKTQSANSMLSWNKIGTLANPVVDPVVVVLNNRMYAMGGATTVGGTPQRVILSASMSDLANGVANFNYEGATDVTSPTPLALYPFSTFGTGNAGMANAMPVCVKNTVYFYDCRTANVPLPYKTHNHAKYNLIGTNGISNGAPQVVVSDDGTLGSVSYFQKNGMLPWHVSEY